MIERLKKIKERFDELTKDLINPDVLADMSIWQKKSKEQSDLAPIVEKYDEYIKVESDMKDAEEMMKIETDADMLSMLNDEYYGGKERFPQFDAMMEAVDKVDSGNLTIDEVMNPTGWILIGFLMDPRTGLGRWRKFTISNYQLMEKLIDACRTMTTDEILNLPDVKERIDVYFEQTEKFKEMVTKYTQVGGNVIISDLRGVDPIYSGNRFLIYSMYPEQNISVGFTIIFRI